MIIQMKFTDQEMQRFLLMLCCSLCSMPCFFGEQSADVEG